MTLSKKIEYNTYQIKGIREMMYGEICLKRDIFMDIDNLAISELIEEDLINNSIRVFLLNQNGFIFSNKKDIITSINYDDTDEGIDPEEGDLKLIYWEELGNSDVSIELADEDFNKDNATFEIKILSNPSLCEMKDSFDEYIFTDSDYSILINKELMDYRFESQSYGMPSSRKLIISLGPNFCTTEINLDDENELSSEIEEFKEQV